MNRARRAALVEDLRALVAAGGIVTGRGAAGSAGGGAPVGRELLELEAALLELEREQGALEDDMATMDLLRDPGGERAAALERLRALERRRRDLIDTARARMAERLAGGRQ
jgi:hypothetical protein